MGQKQIQHMTGPVWQVTDWSLGCRGSDSPEGTPLSSRDDTRLPRSEKPPTGLMSSWGMNRREVAQTDSHVCNLEVQCHQSLDRTARRVCWAIPFAQFHDLSLCGSTRPSICNAHAAKPACSCWPLAHIRLCLWTLLWPLPAYVS